MLMIFNSLVKGQYELFGSTIEKSPRSTIIISGTWIKDRLKGKIWINLVG